MSGAGDVQLYVNGGLADSDLATGVGFWGNNNASGLGIKNGSVAAFTTTNAFQGEIATMRFYESALTAGDIAANYAAMTSAVNLTAVNLDTAGTLGLVYAESRRNIYLRCQWAI